MDLNKIECQLADYIDKTLRIPSLSEKLSNQTFSDLIKKEIDILIYLEKKNDSKSEASAAIVKNFNMLSKSNQFIVNHDFIYETSDLDDDVNSLKVFVMNLFSINLETYDPSTEKKVSQTPNNSAENNTVSPSQMVIPEAMKGLINNSGDPYKNAFFSTTAQMRLNSEIREGKIFALDNKPKIIPIIKIVAGCIMFVSAIVSILLSMFMLMANKANTGSAEPARASYSTTWTAMIYFVTGLLFCYGGWNMIKPIVNKKNRNENQIYRLNWQPYILIGFFFLISMMLEYMSSIVGGTLFDLLKSMAINPANANIKMALEGWYVMGIWSFVNMGIAASIIILGIFYNPKFDQQKLNELIKQYIDELISSAKK